MFSRTIFSLASVIALSLSASATATVINGQIEVNGSDREINVEDSVLQVIPSGTSSYYPITFRSPHSLTITFMNESGTVELHTPTGWTENAINSVNDGTPVNLSIRNGSLDVAYEGIAMEGQGVISLYYGGNLEVDRDLKIDFSSDYVSITNQSVIQTVSGIRSSCATLNIGGTTDISFKAGNLSNTFSYTSVAGLLSDPRADGVPVGNHEWNFGSEVGGGNLYIHDIHSLNASGTADAYGVLIQLPGTTMNVYGSAIIENIHAVTAGAPEQGAYAAGIEVAGGEVNFLGDLTIRNISAQSEAPAVGTDWQTFTSGTATEHDAAYAISVYDNGEVNINAAQSSTTNVVIENDLFVASGGLVSANFMNEASHFTGRTFELPAEEAGAYNLQFANGAIWNMTDDSIATDLVVAGNGRVNFRAASHFVTLSTASLSGESGVFDFKINTQSKETDRLLVTGTHTGTHYVTVSADDASADAIGTVLVSVADEQGTFEALDTEGDLFWERHTLEKSESSTEGFTTDWKLAGTQHVEDPSTGEEEETTTTATVRASGAIDYLMWRQETDILRDRLSELRHPNLLAPNAGWARVSYGSLGRSGTHAFDGDYVRVQAGYDHNIKPADNVDFYIGSALDFRRGNADYAEGSSDNDAYGLSLYLVSLWESGAYIDSSIRYAYMTNDNASLDSEGRRVTWDAHAHALSASIEIGRKFSLSPVWFFEPHVKATAGRLWFDDDQTNTGVSVIFDDMTSFLGRAGFTLGADFSKTFQLAVRASVIKEFEGEYRATLASGTQMREQKDKFDDAWGQFGLDISYQWSDHKRLFANVLYETSAGDVDNGFILNAGLRWTF